MGHGATETGRAVDLFGFSQRVACELQTMRYVLIFSGEVRYARPSKPAASSRLMLMSGLSCSRLGLAIIDMVWFITNRPRLAMFWRMPTGRACSVLVADIMKIDQSLRL